MAQLQSNLNQRNVFADGRKKKTLAFPVLRSVPLPYIKECFHGLTFQIVFWDRNELLMFLLSRLQLIRLT